MMRNSVLGAAQPKPSVFRQGSLSSRQKILLTIAIRQHNRFFSGRKLLQVRTNYKTGSVCLMGGFQYKRRVERLVQGGVIVHDFGTRVIKEQCYGEDVVSLQQFLGEEGYFNSMDGVTGYFGSVTREALMNWQRDQGLQVTGEFNNNCRWAYLKQQEIKAAEAVQPVMSVPVGKVQPICQTGFLAAAPAWQIYAGVALLAITTLGTVTRPLKQEIPEIARRNSRTSVGDVVSSTMRLVTSAASMIFGIMLRGFATSFRLTLGLLRVTGSTVAMCAALLIAAAYSIVRFVLRAVITGMAVIGGAIKNVYFATLFHLIKVHKLQSHVAKYPAKEPARAVSTNPTSIMTQTTAQPAHAQENVAVGHDDVNLPRFSDEEIQKRIAVMKKDAPQQSSVKRPGPRPLHASSSGVSITSSKYGNYYGGPEVREEIKELLNDKKGPMPASGPSRRMQALGYPIPPGRIQGRTDRRNASAKAGETDEQAPLSPVAAALARRQFNPPATLRPLQGAAQSHPTFQDVLDEEHAVDFEQISTAAVSANKPAISSHLLAGTELETELPLKPVRVQKPGMQAMSSVEVSNGVASSAAEPAGASQQVAVAKPVPVVKDRHLTVGELMQAAALDLEVAECAEGAASAPQQSRYNDDSTSQQRNDAQAPAVVVSKGPIPVHKPAMLADREAELWRVVEQKAQGH